MFGHTCPEQPTRAADTRTSLRPHCAAYYLIYEIYASFLSSTLAERRRSCPDLRFQTNPYRAIILTLPQFVGRCQPGKRIFSEPFLGFLKCAQVHTRARGEPTERAGRTRRPQRSSRLNDRSNDRLSDQPPTLRGSQTPATCDAAGELTRKQKGSYDRSP